jgi:hypothetical protein
MVCVLLIFFAAAFQRALDLGIYLSNISNFKILHLIRSSRQRQLNRARLRDHSASEDHVAYAHR